LLEVALEPKVHLRAVDHGARSRVVAHLGECERRAQHVGGELVSAFGVIGRDAYLVVNGKAAIAPTEHAAAKFLRGHALLDQKIQHRAAKPALEQRLRNWRQWGECAIDAKHPVGAQNMDVRMEAHQVAEGLIAGLYWHSASLPSNA